MMKPALRPLGRLVCTLVLMGAAPLALAHSEGETAGGLISGLMHPISGWDHVVAMLAVGLWGAFLGRPAVWLLPVVFPLVMAFGGVLGVLGVPMPGVEIGIAMSAVVLGLAVALAWQPPLQLAAMLVGVFAIFHGHAHGAELPDSASPIAYSLGFVVATGALHAAGIGLSLVTRWSFGAVLVRAAGALIAAVGLWFLWRALA